MERSGFLRWLHGATILLGVVLVGVVPLWAQEQDQEAASPEAAAAAPAANEAPAAEPAQPATPAPPAETAPPPPQIRPAVPSSGRANVVPPQPAQSAPKGNADSSAARPKEGAVQSEPTYLDFEGVELSKVVKAIGAQTGKNFLLDPSVGNVTVTLISHAPISPDMLLPALQSVLLTHGFTMRETLDGQLIIVRPVAEGSDKAPLVIGSRELPKGFDEFSTHVVPLKYAVAEELAKLLPRLGTKDCKVDVYGPTNTLIISDNAHGIRNILEFIEVVDVAGSEVVMETFSLDYARAEVLAAQLQEVLVGPETGGRGVPQQQMVRPPVPQVRPPVPGQLQQQTIVSTQEPQLRIVPDERLNLLIVMAPESLMSKVRDLIEKLDVPMPTEASNMRVYQLQNADAEKVKEKLNTIIGIAPRTTTGQAGRVPTASGVSSVMAASGAAAPGEIQPFEKKVIIESYEPTNSLLIVASPQDFAVLKALIEQLDIPQRQVHVESIIMEVVIQDRFELAVESQSLSGYDGFAINNVVQLANLLANGPFGSVGGSDNPVLTTGVLDGFVDIPVPDGQGGLTTRTVPKVPLLLTALDSVTDLDVLSQPLLTTVDNEEASITIGEEVPVVRGTSSSLDQTAVGRSIYSQVERRDVGIKMKVKPQISEGDYVFLELEVEVSQPKQSTVGADPNIVGPTFQKSNVTNKIVIRDGSTGVVGGLISETTDRSKRQAPYFGDVPVLGWLFRRTADKRAKRNLVVLVTPHVIKEGVDADRITQTRLDEFRKANLDVLFEKGFIKKIKRRHYMRTEYHPSSVRLQQMDSESGFNRGNLEATP
ncbi:MAG TPA: type II secretion system secretin GspD [Candidatus Hydrogenedentes bacterium]|nr:type II secretion system secretin GspD [Candidatus Hydrogenedentota bacterium]HOL77938.1 type II secretion system secretin GspD [Candidatus Hydrogenedentota bacterium]HPO85248.1 type II secretion system secretin GspD [Candidatus Hydrogenedentota bacterium]